MLKGGIHGNLESGNQPKKWPLTGTVTMKDMTGNNLPDRKHTMKLANQEGGRRGSKNVQRFASMSCANDSHRSANWTAHVVQWNTRALQIRWGPTHSSRTSEGKTAGCIGLSLTLPKFYLATSTEDETICCTVTTSSEKYTHLLVYHNDKQAEIKPNFWSK